MIGRRRGPRSGRRHDERERTKGRVERLNGDKGVQQRKRDEPGLHKGGKERTPAGSGPSPAAGSGFDEFLERSRPLVRSSGARVASRGSKQSVSGGYYTPD